MKEGDPIVEPESEPTAEELRDHIANVHRERRKYARAIREYTKARTYLGKVEKKLVAKLRQTEHKEKQNA